MTDNHSCNQCIHYSLYIVNSAQTFWYFLNRVLVRFWTWVPVPLMWNALPLTVHDVSLTLTHLCTQLKTFLFSRAYGTSS